MSTMQVTRSRCAAAVLSNAASCEACGHKLGAGRKGAGRTAGYPFAESLQQHRLAKQTRTRFALPWSLPLLALALVLGLVAAVTGTDFFVLVGALIALLSGGSLFLRLRVLRGKHYYRLPYSRDSDGDHRCIFCGNRGIYRKGEYRTENTHCYCSKCGAYLYLE